MCVRKRVQEIIADKLSKTGWSWACDSAIDSNGRTIFVADAHRDDGKRYFVRARPIRSLRERLHKKSIDIVCRR